MNIETTLELLKQKKGGSINKNMRTVQVSLTIRLGRLVEGKRVKKATLLSVIAWGLVAGMWPSRSVLWAQPIHHSHKQASRLAIGLSRIP